MTWVSSPNKPNGHKGQVCMELSYLSSHCYDVISHAPMLEVYLKRVSGHCSNRQESDSLCPAPYFYHTHHDAKLPGSARKEISQGGWNGQKLEISLGSFSKPCAHFGTWGPKPLLSTPLHLTGVIIMPLWEINPGMHTAEVSLGCFLGIYAAYRHLKMSFHSSCSSILSLWSWNHFIWVFYHHKFWIWRQLFFFPTFQSNNHLYCQSKL